MKNNARYKRLEIGMHIIAIFLIVIFFVQIGTSQNSIDELKIEIENSFNEDLLNETFWLFKYQFPYQLNIDLNLQELKFTYRHIPENFSFSTTVKDEYAIFPISSLHPKSFKIIERDESIVLSLKNRKYKSRFDIILDNGNAKYFNKDSTAVRFNRIEIDFPKRSKKKLAKAVELFEQLVGIINSDISPDEKPPIHERIPYTSNIRNSAIVLTSEIEQKELVLPPEKVHKLPHSRKSTNFDHSVYLLEQSIIETLNLKRQKLKHSVFGFFFIDAEGKIFEVLMADQWDFKPIEIVRELILKDENWTPAKYNGKSIICKVKFVIDKEKFDL